MESNKIYYANNRNGAFSIAIKYEPGQATEFCKAAMTCGVFATITAVGNVRVFTHRQVSRLLSGKPAVLTIASGTGRVLVQIWNVKLFEEEHTLSESLVGLVLGDTRNIRSADGKKIYYYTVSPGDNANKFITDRCKTMATNFTVRNGQLVRRYAQQGMAAISEAEPAGSLIMFTERNNTFTLDSVPGTINDYLSTLDATTIITMFLKVVGVAGSYGDIMRISLAKTVFSRSEFIQMGVFMLLENMGYKYELRFKTSGILYPLGNEEDAAVFYKNDFLVFQLDKKEMTLSIVSWDEKDSEG